MKRLLLFLILLGILLGACYGTYYYLRATGYLTALADHVRNLVHEAIREAGLAADGAPVPDDPSGTPPVQPGTPDANPQKPPHSGPGYDEEGRLTDPDEALYTLLYDAAISFTEEVDISHLGYTTATLEGEVSRFFFTNPELFYVDNGYSVYTAGEGGVVQRIRLRYLTTPTVAQSQLAFYHNVLDEVVSGIPAGATEFDKVLYLHDYLVQNYAYDYAGLATEQATGESVAVRDVYTFFSGKVGVCQAYMLAMIALCEEAGISCLPVTSDAMSHAWNLVRVDGEWYHVDVTWDDAGGAQSAVYPSYVSYEYFLLSGEALYEGGRTAQWLASERSDSEKYDTAIWHKTTTRMQKYGADYLCVVYDTVQKAPKIYKGAPEQMSAVQTLDARWYISPSAYYQQAWASIVVWEDTVLLNTAKGFLYYNVQSNVLSEAVDLSASLGGKQIFGVCGVAADGAVTYVAATAYSGAFETHTWQIPLS